MVFKELEIQGFKSFPDKVKIRFDAGVTGVVGPNGSGKSNLSDAVRWVLGETSSRQLRAAGKMEDVIFGGTRRRGAMGFAHDAQGQCHGPGGGDLGAAGQVSGVDHAHGHPLGDVVQGDGQHHHGGALEPAGRALGLAAVLVDVWDRMVQQQQKQHADPKADKRRKKGPMAHGCGLVNGGDEQTPHGGGHHHPGGKAGEGALYHVAEGTAHEKYASRP